MLNQAIRHKKKEKKISLDKANKETKKQKHIDIFDQAPKLIDLIIPDFVEEKRDYIALGENKYVRSFVLSVYPNKTYLGWLDRIFTLLRRCDIKYY